MANQTWVNVSGTWRKVKSAWVNVNGAWKKDVMPKGVVSGSWKEFMSYGSYFAFVDNARKVQGYSSSLGLDFTGNVEIGYSYDSTFLDHDDLGNVYALSYSGRTVFKYNKAGELVTSFGVGNRDYSIGRLDPQDMIVYGDSVYTVGSGGNASTHNFEGMTRKSLDGTTIWGYRSNSRLRYDFVHVYGSYVYALREASRASAINKHSKSTGELIEWSSGFEESRTNILASYSDRIFRARDSRLYRDSGMFEGDTRMIYQTDSWSTINKIIYDNNSNIVLGANDGLYKVRQLGSEIWRWVPSNLSGNVKDLVCDKSGDIIAMTNTHVYKVSGTSGELIESFILDNEKRNLSIFR